MNKAQYQLAQAFRDFGNSLKEFTKIFEPFVLRSLQEVEPPKSLLKPKKPWEHLNKTAYKSKKS